MNLGFFGVCKRFSAMGMNIIIALDLLINTQSTIETLCKSSFVRLSGFFTIRGRKLLQGNLFRRFVLVFNNLK